MKKALITGITGQDGSYLSELLLAKGYEVHGIVRRVALEDPSHRMWRIRHLLKDIQLHSASIESIPSIHKVFVTLKPDECYHLASQSFVSYSFEDEFSTMNTNINGTHYVLAVLRETTPECKFYFAGSSEMFGKAREVPQNEDTPFHPRSSYGISKVAGFDLTRNYREGYGLFAVSGILFNHESPRRGFEYVTRKITYNVARIKHGVTKELKLGNLDARRDWGHASDYVQAVWRIMCHKEPDDFVISSGETHSVREFCEAAFSHVGLRYQDHVVVDKDLFRPAETHILMGDSAKAGKILGWKYSRPFVSLVQEMVEADLKYVTDHVGG